jgi:hypothetical protein
MNLQKQNNLFKTNRMTNSQLFETILRNHDLLQLVNLHRNRRYFVIKLHTWFCLSYFLKTNITFYCIYQYFMSINRFFNTVSVSRRQLDMDWTGCIELHRFGPEWNSYESPKTWLCSFGHAQRKNSCCKGHHHHFSSNVKKKIRESRRDNHTLKYALPSRESARGGKRALMLTILKDLLYK